MKTRFLFVLLLVLVSLTSPGRAQFPKLLDDWQSWVLWDETKHGGKPTALVHGTGERRPVIHLL